jgi:hypothetical protein
MRTLNVTHRRAAPPARGWGRCSRAGAPRTAPSRPQMVPKRQGVDSAVVVLVYPPGQPGCDADAAPLPHARQGAAANAAITAAAPASRPPSEPGAPGRGPAPRTGGALVAPDGTGATVPGRAPPSRVATAAAAAVAVCVGEDGGAITCSRAIKSH